MITVAVLFKKKNIFIEFLKNIAKSKFHKTIPNQKQPDLPKNANPQNVLGGSTIIESIENRNYPSRFKSINEVAMMNNVSNDHDSETTSENFCKCSKSSCRTRVCPCRKEDREFNSLCHIG
jgi:hypothetical protein